MRWLVLGLALSCAGCAPADGCLGADLSPPARAPTFALVSSDYASSAIALLDADAAVITEAWLDSGTVRPGIVAALSGDVSLPLAPLTPCALGVIDRFGTDVVSILDTCADRPVRSQVDVGSTFAANPHDVLQVDGMGGPVWITRYSVNASADAGALGRGNDIAIVEGGRVVSRIDLSVADRGEVFARPTRMVRLEHPNGTARVVVGLARLSADFMRAGPGAVAIVDPDARAVTAVYEIEGLEHCSELDAIEDVVVVTCSGQTFAEESVRRAGSGVVALRLGADGELAEVVGWRAADHPDDPVPSGPTIPISVERWVTVAWADTDFGDGTTNAMDRVLLIDGQARELFESTPFTIGDGVYDAASDTLLLPDAELGGLRRLRADGTEREPILTAGCRGLPPREVRRVAFP